MRAPPPRPSPALRTLLLLGLLAAAGCVAHDKAGDKAAALGDWKSAYLEYRQAVQDDAKDPTLPQKLADARARALAQTTAQAKACARQRDWGCALSESDFALSIDPASAELGEVRREAGRNVALDKVRAAEDAIARGQLQPASQLLAEARRISREPAVDAAAREAERRWVGAALAEAEQLRAARRYPEAIALAQGAAGLDPAARPQLDRLTREYEAFRDAEHDRLVAEGEGALGRHAWADAASRFQAAQAARPDERARALERCASLLLAGDQAVERGDFREAAQRYQDAAALRVDRTGYAAAQLSRVAVRPWALRIRSVLVDPLRPDGAPWLGRPSPRLGHISRELARGFDGIPFALLGQIPRDNQPSLLVELTLPDGRRLATPPRQGAYVSFDSSVVLLANAYDRRRVTLQVVHRERGGQNERVGAVELTVGELVARSPAQLRGGSVLVLEVSAESADGAQDGSTSGLASLDGPPPAAPRPLAPAGAPPPRPAPGR